MTSFVIDNSVTMRWCFDSGSHAYADAVLQRLETRQSDAIAPILWRYETSAVLARAQRNGVLTEQRVKDFFDDLAALPITVDTNTTDAVFAEIHRLAVTYRLTSYDAAYLELAMRKKLPLATLDDELRKACISAGVGIF